VPAFSLPAWRREGLAGLPDPGTPFGLSFHGGVWQLEQASAVLKQLAKLTSLQSLNLHGKIEIKDAWLKELAGLTNLQWLDLGGVRMTDAGRT
jgi:hypothetical protein